MRTHAVHTPLHRAATRRARFATVPAALVALAALCLCPLMTGAATITVDVSGAGDHLTIQAGLDAAIDGDTVQVAPGTYTGGDNRNLDFGTKNLVLQSQGGASVTIIDAQAAGDRVFDFTGTGQDTSCVIDGFTIRGGRTAFEDGAAIRCVASVPKVVSCRFEDNQATGGDGGAIAMSSGAHAVVRDCVFVSNAATRGGAIHASGNSSPKLSACLFQGNAAADEGGAFYLGSNSGIALATGCVFLENHSGVNGGAITCEVGSLNATDCTLLRNTADEGGGAVHASEGATAFLTSCTFVGNEAALQGGCLRASENTYWCVLSQCIVAFTGPCNQRTVYADGTSAVTLNFSCAYGNTPGDNLPHSPDDYFIADPLFCDVTADNLTLAENSPCLPGNNPWGFLIGSYGEGCTLSPVEERSWSSIKAMYR